MEMGCRPLNATRTLILLLGFVASSALAAPFVYVTQPASIAVREPTLRSTNAATAPVPRTGRSSSGP